MQYILINLRYYNDSEVLATLLYELCELCNGKSQANFQASMVRKYKKLLRDSSVQNTLRVKG